MDGCPLPTAVNYTPQFIEGQDPDVAEIGARGGRFGLYLCNVDSTTPPANLQAAIEAIQTYV